MENLKLPSYGGQALIEGVLMRGSKGLAAAMRAPDGHIEVKTEQLSGIYKSNFRNIPFLRGLLLLWDALGLGIRYLTLSANLQTGDDEKIEGPTLYFTLILSLGISIALFFVLPALTGQGLEILFGWNAWIGNLMEGLIRLLIMVLYIWGIGRLPDIKRVFSYHGAEHKTINAYESGLEITSSTVMQASKVHPRCGTSFLLTVILLSIVLFSALGPLSIVMRLISRIVLIPFVACVAYEYIRWISKNLKSPIVRTIIKPNLALQRLTTLEPTQEMVEVSITAFKAMLKIEEAQ